MIDYITNNGISQHWDFFPPEDNTQHKVYCEWMGQRTWTTMIYLNDVQNGGETYFKSLDLKIKPKRGSPINFS